MTLLPLTQYVETIERLVDADPAAVTVRMREASWGECQALRHDDGRPVCFAEGAGPKRSVRVIRDETVPGGFFEVRGTR